MQVELSSLSEGCPNCGAFLAKSLTIPPNVSIPSASPKFQTAYDLTQFKLDIPNLRIAIGNRGSMAIVGPHANLILTRLCIRSLLPSKHGGLGSRYAVVVDAGNKSDFYLTVNFIKAYGMNLRNTLDRIVVSRTFTIYQLKSLLQRELSKVIENYQADIVLVPGLLDLFDDPNIKKKEARRMIVRIMHILEAISKKAMVITSIVKSDYSKLVLSKFDKTLILSPPDRTWINAEISTNGNKVQTKVTEEQLARIHSKYPTTDN